jgi:hypothetical protein
MLSSAADALPAGEGWRVPQDEYAGSSRGPMRLKRTIAAVVALASMALATDGLAQGVAAPSAEALRVTWRPREYGVVPAIEGEVQNDSPFRVSAVRLRVEGFDASGQSVGETSTWTFGNIAPGGRGHFVVPPLPRATTYRITVSAFDRVSREQPASPQSP